MEELTVDQIIQADGGAQAPPQLPAEIAGIEMAKFQEALAEASGGAVKSHQDIQALLSERAKLIDLDSKYRELEAKSAISPFADPLVEAINVFRRNGGTDDETEQFLKLQRIQLDSLSPKAAILTSMRFDKANTGLNEEQLLALYEDTYGVDQEQSPVQQAREIQAANVAREKLAAMKVQQPAVMAQRQAQEQAMQQKSAEYSKLADFIVSKGKELPLTFKDNGEESGFNFPIPQDEGFLKAVKEQLVLAAVNGGPLTQERVEDLNQAYQMFVWGKYGPQIAEAIWREKGSRTREQEARRMSNAGPIQKGSGVKAPQVQTQQNYPGFS